MIRRGPHHKQNFTILYNSLLRDPRLSLRARGLLAYLLSQQPEYRVSSNRLAASQTEGRDAIRKALNELKNAGYMRMLIIRQEDGRITRDWVVYEVPKRIKTKKKQNSPGPENPSLVRPA